jgi:radical SAM protein with 4Fe4S-binding SPASM domain
MITLSDAKELYSIFKDHYTMMENDPQTIIMQRANNSTLKSPLFVSWEITSICNLVCKHCRAAYNNSRKKETIQPLEKYIKLLQELNQLEIYCLGITGGEPFLHPYIWDVLYECKKLNFNLIVYTNGTCIGLEEAKTLKKLLKEDDIVHVSLDGGTAEANDRQRGKGCFNKTCQALGYLRDVGLTVRLNIVPTIYNVETIPDLCKLALEYKVAEMGASPLMFAGRALEQDIMPEQETLFKMEQIAYNMLKNSKTKYIGGISGTVHNYIELPQWFEENIYQLKRKENKLKICDAGNRKICIDAAGDVYPCSLFASHKEYIAGNVFNSTLNEIWVNEFWNQFRQGIEICDEQCPNCKLFSLCNGGCMALAYNAFGKLGAKDPRCKFQGK